MTEVRVQGKTLVYTYQLDDVSYALPSASRVTPKRGTLGILSIPEAYTVSYGLDHFRGAGAFRDLFLLVSTKRHTPR